MFTTAGMLRSSLGANDGSGCPSAYIGKAAWDAPDKVRQTGNSNSNSRCFTDLLFIMTFLEVIKRD
jgi:hypothetical protein